MRRIPHPSSSLSEPQAEEVTIVNGFQDGATVAVGESGLRIGKGYYEFSGYDSLRISFVARRSEPDPEAVQVGVKVGPVTYRWDSLATEQWSLLFCLGVSDLPKPRVSALVILVRGTRSPLLLSELLVVGTRH